MSKFKMDSYKACGLIEGYEDPEAFEECGLTVGEQTLAAWQYLIDTGAAWRLQGFYGRGAQALIESGQCEPAKVAV